MATGIMGWICLFIFIIIVSSPLIIVLWSFHQDSNKIFRVVWRYDYFCSPTTELIKAKDPYDAWRKVQKKHALSIDLIEVSEFV